MENKSLKIAVLKLGWDYYRNNVDRNSGGYETKMIVQALKDEITENVDFINDTPASEYTSNVYDLLIVIGGIQTRADYYNYSQILSKRRTFIATDVDCFKHNRPFIVGCDTLLTQTTQILPEYSNIRQMYSWVPELFFRDNVAAGEMLGHDFMDTRIRKVFFGGSIDGREDMFKKYFSDDELCMVIHKDKKEDNRLPYPQYLQAAREYNFTLMIVTEEARKIGWVTSRLFEALAYGVIPFADMSYDSNELYFSKDDYTLLRVDNMEDLQLTIELQPRELILQSRELYEHALKNMDNFFSVIRQCI